MKLADLLLEERIAIPMEVDDLGEAVELLLSRLDGADLGKGDEVRRLSSDLAAGASGEVVRVNDDIVLVIGRVEALEAMAVTLGVAKGPFNVGGGEEVGTARVVLMLLTPRGLHTVKSEIVPTLGRVLRDEDRTRRLLSAGSVAGVRALKELMETELHERHLVSDATTPVRYRVYPDTPLIEIVDLIIRRGLRAIPVVGERYEVLGLITVGDALERLLPKRRSSEPDVAGDDLLARDVMTRSVLCVSEEQPLIDAASMIVNRGVDQLPVVREGELVGFLTRESILRLLFTSAEPGEIEG